MSEYRSWRKEELWVRLAVKAFAVLMGLLILLLVAVCLSGCFRIPGENTKSSTDSSSSQKTAVDAASALQFQGSSLRPNVTGAPVVVTASGNSVVNFRPAPTPSATSLRPSDAEEIRLEQNIDAKSKTASAEKKHTEDEVKSAWYWFILAISGLIFCVIFAYIKMQVLPAWNFAKSKVGGKILGEDFIDVLDDFRGKSTDGAVCAAMTQVKDIYRKKLLKLEAKKRAD